MKRILSTLLMLTMVMAATADEELYVAGEQLDLSKTYSQVYLSALGGGYFDYYPSAKRLILTGVTIERSGDGKNGIDSSVAGLKIEFVGTNSIKTSAACLKLQSNTTLVNEGTVNLTCKGSNEGIYIMNTSKVDIYGGTWKIQASSGTGIEGKDKNQIVYIHDDEYCPLYLTVNGKNGCILDLKYLWVANGLDVCEPIRGKLNQDYILSYDDLTQFETALYKVGTTNPIKNQDVEIGTPAFELGGHGFTTNTTSIIASTITGVTYINSTKTLKMSNASTTEGSFVPRLDDMTIELNRTNTLNYSGDERSIYAGKKKLTIQGNGTLNTGPMLVNGSLDIKGGATVNITNDKNTKPGIEGIGVVRVDASTSNTTLNIDVKPEAVCCSAKIELLGSIISSPSNAILADKTKVEGYNFYTVNKDGEGCYIIDKDLNDIKDQLSIVKGTAYDLWVGGVRVNSANKNNLNNGSCSYNTSTKTLQLNNAKISLTNDNFACYAIDNGIDGFTIQNQGTSELSSKYFGIYSNKTFTIKGNGHLKVTGGSKQLDNSAIYFEGTDHVFMTISDIELTVTGGGYGIYGNVNFNTMSYSIVNVLNSILHLYGSTQAIFVSNFDPDGNCYITTPSGGINTGGTITDASGTPAKTVELRPMVKYNLWIDGNQVTETNYSNLAQFLSSASGTLSYSPSTNTLNMNNFNLITPTKDYTSPLIKNQINGLNIQLTGENNISTGTSTERGLYSNGNLNIKGNGSLSFVNQTNPFEISGTLTMTGTTSLNTFGKNGTKMTRLNMSSSTSLSVNSGSTTEKTLSIDYTPSLNGVALPNTMYYDSSLKCVAYTSTRQPVIREKVTINAENVSQIATDINEIAPIEEVGETDIYTPSGILVWKGTGQPQLPSGIYMIKKGGKTKKVQF